MSEKFYVTTSIAYVNAPPHIGFALESVQADVLARFYRQSGKDVYFLTGTDEHGAKIARAAEEAGATPEKLTDNLSGKFKNLKKALNLSWDNFVRTSDQKAHWPVAQEIWNMILKAGDLEQKIYKGLYCVGCEAFITEKDLVNGKCAIHQTAPEKIEEKNWFFKLSKYGKELEKKIKSDELKIVPESRKNEVLSFLKEGLDDVSFSRPSKDLKWGVPVPGDDTQTMYVWADALTNYISGYGGIKAWEKHPADIHIIGKDILRFHAIIWPAMLLSAKLSLPKNIYVHGFITVDRQKMSKSLGNTISPFDLVEMYKGADAVRYFLLREIPSSEDGDFNYIKFKERYNGDLANGIGNFASRVSTLACKEKELEYKKSSLKYVELVENNLNNFSIDKALVAIMDLVRYGDGIMAAEKPWDKAVTEQNRRKCLSALASILYDSANLLNPFLPETSEKILENMEIKGKKIIVKKKIENLFPRL
ncbi:MAG: methionine--tRNA ligase [Candidatus Pacebacteria bacterium]|nr:methionine--tRNA ligase [Candidatus Paceibacterota bacterium]